MPIVIGSTPPPVVNTGLVWMADPGSSLSYFSNAQCNNIQGNTALNLMMDNGASVVQFASNGAIKCNLANVAYVNSNSNDWKVTQNFTFETWVVGTTATADWTTLTVTAFNTSWSDGWGVSHYQEADKTIYNYWINNYLSGGRCAFSMDTTSAPKYVSIVFEQPTMKVYINGSQVNSASYWFPPSFFNSPYMYFGGDYLAAQSNAIYQLGADLYVPKYYNRALSNTEIDQNFKAHRHRFGV